MHTIDSIFSDDIRIKQPKRGYRFALDAVLLAHFLRTQPADDVLEIGCGVGVIAILLSHLQRFQKITCIELQKELADLAAENLKSNHVVGEVFAMNAKDIAGGNFDLIYSNPPYRKVGHGKLNPLKQKAVARHEIELTLSDLFECAKRLLTPGGRLSLILPDFREADFRKLVKLHKFHWHELRYVHAFADNPPQFFLATVGLQTRKCIEHPRLIIYQSPGQYTAETLRLCGKS